MKLFYKQTFRISRLSKIYRAFRRFTGFENDARNAFIAKIKEPHVQTQFLVAGVERFELPDDGVRVRSLTAWRYPNTHRVALASYLAKTIQPLYNTRLFVFLQVF